MIIYNRNKQVDRKEIERETPHHGLSNELIIYPFRSSLFSQRSELHSENLDIYEMEGKISINGFYVSGYVAYGKGCEFCGHTTIYDIDHCTDFCPNCNVWLFEGCSDPHCEMCTTRPERPLPDFGVNDDTFPVRSRGGWDRYLMIYIDA